MGIKINKKNRARDKMANEDEVCKPCIIPQA